MSVIHPHYSFPEDCLPFEAAVWWRDHADLFLRVLTTKKYQYPVFGGTLSGNLLIYPPECNIKEIKLNGRKSTRSGSRSGSGDVKSSPIHWCNIPLTPEDLDLLAKETADLEQLALAFVTVGSVGFGLSVKFDSTGKSFNCSIYGPDLSNDGRPCGVSGRSPDLRDALLVLLFRFNSRLQGSFDGQSNSDTAIQPRRFY